MVLPSPTPSMLAPCRDGFVYLRNASTCLPCVSVQKAVIGSFCNGTDDIYPCEKGSFCPSVDRWLPCPKGSICRRGAFEPYTCFGGALSCPEGGLGECANVLATTIVFAVFFIGVWLVFHGIISFMEAQKNRLSSLRFEITSQTIHDFTIVFPYAMRWRRKTLTARKTNKMKERTVKPLTPEAERRLSTISATSPNQVQPNADRRPSTSVSMHKTIQPNTDERRPSISSIRISDSERQWRKSLQNISGKVRAVQIASVTADAFSDIPHTRAFKHALRRLHEPPASMNIDLDEVSVAADHAHAAKLRNDITGNERPVVKEVSCTIRAGKFTAIMGPSGCGKSTLLKALAAAGEGPVFVAGGITYGGEARPLSKPLPDMCFMPQESVIYPDLTA
eukprot:Opistho-2@83532